MSADRIYFFSEATLYLFWWSWKTPVSVRWTARIETQRCDIIISANLSAANLPPHKYSECHPTLRFPFAVINSPHMRMHKDVGKLMSSRIDFFPPTLVGLTVSGVSFRSISVSAFYPRPLLFFFLSSIQPIPKRCICSESRKNWPTTHLLYHRKTITFKFN